MSGWSFFNHTLSGQASRGILVHQYLVSILSPEELAILESRSAEEGNNFSTKECVGHEG